MPHLPAAAREVLQQQQDGHHLTLRGGDGGGVGRRRVVVEHAEQAVQRRGLEERFDELRAARVVARQQWRHQLLRHDGECPDRRRSSRELQ